MTPPLAYSSYRTNGRDEPLLTSGDDEKARVLMLPPLFAELNRVRRVLCDTVRALAEHGIGAAIPDLPGTNESSCPLADVGWSDWTAAARDAVEQTEPVACLAIRGGALLVPPSFALPVWQLAPVAGRHLARTLVRSRIAGDREAGRRTDSAAVEAELAAGSATLAGYDISRALYEGLHAATPFPGGRIVQVAGGATETDGEIAGPAPWLRAEPGDDPQFSEAIATGIRNWIGT